MQKFKKFLQNTKKKKKKKKKTTKSKKKKKKKKKRFHATMLLIHSYLMYKISITQFNFKGYL
ncbi:hypothetical protein FIM73_01680 [Helicobacter pylori]|nr:hypothetical protein FIM73_01680 [Helicobacter pylori]